MAMLTLVPDSDFEQAIGTARTRTKVMKRILATLLPMLPILITGLLASLQLSN
jgi:hypothetical protein